MRMEKKIEIKSSPKRIYDILIDAEIITKWNPGVNEITEKKEGEEFFLKSSVGDILIVGWEQVENESATWHMKNSTMNSLGYVLQPKGDIVETTLWADLDNKKLAKGYEKVGELTLKALKNFVDFLEEGGNPKDFDKKKLIVSQ
ncbi:MAG: hypothetical protein KGD72_04585 [Candidatus Lokiarchaeota archaeon]|nr:hypothetical protein [Candidatus Lokiarchaeota archaeon]